MDLLEILLFDDMEDCTLFSKHTFQLHIIFTSKVHENDFISTVSDKFFHQCSVERPQKIWVWKESSNFFHLIQNYYRKIHPSATYSNHTRSKFSPVLRIESSEGYYFPKNAGCSSASTKYEENDTVSELLSPIYGFDKLVKHQISHY